MSGWEVSPYLSAEGVGGDIRAIAQATHHTPFDGPRMLRCPYHTRGRPCGLLIDGGIPAIGAHFASVHVGPGRSAKSGRPKEYWTCRWGGECNKPMRRKYFKRHVVSHLVGWKGSNCSKTYSRDDSARKHAKDCGDGMIFMEPR